MASPRMARWTGPVMLSALAITGLAVLTRWIDATGPVPMIQALFPVAGLSAVLLLILAAVLRHRRVVVLAALVACPPLVLAGLSLVPHTVAATSRDETVVAVNMDFGAADATDIVRLVRQRQAGVLVLTEVTPAARERLQEAGIQQLLPHQAGEPRPGFEGTIVYARQPLVLRESVPGQAYPGGRFGDSQIVTVHGAGGAFTLRAVHPAAPLPNITGPWRAELARIGRWQRAQTGPVMIVGDFNASSAHPGFRSMADGLVDAHRQTGAGWVRTWPVGKRYPPFVQLDHVLTRGFAVVDAGTATISSTDHRAIWARVRLR